MFRKVFQLNKRSLFLLFLSLYVSCPVMAKEDLPGHKIDLGKLVISEIASLKNATGYLCAIKGKITEGGLAKRTQVAVSTIPAEPNTGVSKNSEQDGFYQIDHLHCNKKHHLVVLDQDGNEHVRVIQFTKPGQSLEQDIVLNPSLQIRIYSMVNALPQMLEIEKVNVASLQADGVSTGGVNWVVESDKIQPGQVYLAKIIPKDKSYGTLYCKVEGAKTNSCELSKGFTISGRILAPAKNVLAKRKKEEIQTLHALIWAINYYLVDKVAFDWYDLSALSSSTKILSDIKKTESVIIKNIGGYEVDICNLDHTSQECLKRLQDISKLLQADIKEIQKQIITIEKEDRLASIAVISNTQNSDTWMLGNDGTFFSFMATPSGSTGESSLKLTLKANGYADYELQIQYNPNSIGQNYSIGDITLLPIMQENDVIARMESLLYNAATDSSQYEANKGPGSFRQVAGTTYYKATLFDALAGFQYQMKAYPAFKTLTTGELWQHLKSIGFENRQYTVCLEADCSNATKTTITFKDIDNLFEHILGSADLAKEDMTRLNKMMRSAEVLEVITDYAAAMNAHAAGNGLLMAKSTLWFGKAEVQAFAHALVIKDFEELLFPAARQILREVFKDSHPALPQKAHFSGIVLAKVDASLVGPANNYNIVNILTGVENLSPEERSGTIKNRKGLANATITITGSSGKYSTKTNSAGGFLFKDIPSGPYSLNAEHSDYENQRNLPVHVSVGMVQKVLVLGDPDARAEKGDVVVEVGDSLIGELPDVVAIQVNQDLQAQWLSEDERKSFLLTKKSIIIKDAVINKSYAITLHHNSDAFFYKGSFTINTTFESTVKNIKKKIEQKIQVQIQQMKLNAEIIGSTDQTIIAKLPHSQGGCDLSNRSKMIYLSRNSGENDLINTGLGVVDAGWETIVSIVHLLNDVGKELIAYGAWGDDPNYVPPLKTLILAMIPSSDANKLISEAIINDIEQTLRCAGVDDPRISTMSKTKILAAIIGAYKTVGTIQKINASGIKNIKYVGEALIAESNSKFIRTLEDLRIEKGKFITKNVNIDGKSIRNARIVNAQDNNYYIVYSENNQAKFFRVDSTGKIEPACFTAGTKVQSEKGLKNIEDIKPGDLIYTKYSVNQKPVLRRVLKTFVRSVAFTLSLTFSVHTNSILAVSYSSGAENIQLTTTAEHPFWVQNQGWVKADEIKLGSQIRGKNSEIYYLTAKNYNFAETTVYNFSVEYGQSYFVGEEGLWVHNASYDEAGARRTIKAIEEGVAGQNFDEIARAISKGSKDQGAIEHLLNNKGGLKEGIDLGSKPISVSEIQSLRKELQRSILQIKLINGNSKLLIANDLDKTVPDFLNASYASKIQEIQISMTNQFPFNADYLEKFDKFSGNKLLKIELIGNESIRINKKKLENFCAQYRKQVRPNVYGEILYNEALKELRKMEPPELKQILE